jgi:hypothetical protein
LRLLQTVTEVAAEKNSTLVMPLPVEMLRFFDRMSGGSPEAAQHEEEEQAPPLIESAGEVPPIEVPAGVERELAE